MNRVCFGVLRALAMAGVGAAIGPIWAGVLGSGPPTPAPELFDTLPEVPESSGWDWFCEPTNWADTHARICDDVREFDRRVAEKVRQPNALTIVFAVPRNGKPSSLKVCHVRWPEDVERIESRGIPLPCLPADPDPPQEVAGITQWIDFSSGVSYGAGERFPRVRSSTFLDFCRGMRESRALSGTNGVTAAGKAKQMQDIPGVVFVLHGIRCVDSNEVDRVRKASSGWQSEWRKLMSFVRPHAVLYGDGLFGEWGGRGSPLLINMLGILDIEKDEHLSECREILGVGITRPMEGY